MSVTKMHHLCILKECIETTLDENRIHHTHYKIVYVISDKIIKKMYFCHSQQFAMTFQEALN